MTARPMDERERPAFDPAADYRPTMDRLCMLAGLLRDEPIAEMLNHITRIHSIGPILDPTSYARGMRNLDDQRDLLEALLKVQRVVRKLAKEAGHV